MATKTRSDGHRAVDDASQWARPFIATTIPVDLQAEGSDEGVRADRRKRVTVVVVARPARDSVDFIAAETGVVDGRRYASTVLCVNTCPFPGRRLNLTISFSVP